MALSSIDKNILLGLFKNQALSLSKIARDTNLPLAAITKFYKQMGFPPKKRGLACADLATRLRVATAGGVATSQNKEHMAAIGQKGGASVSSDREHMARIGRKGGDKVAEDRKHMSRIGQIGGSVRGKGKHDA